MSFQFSPKIIKERIAYLLERVYGVSVEDIKERNNKRNVSEARKTYCYLLRKYLGYSYPFIGSIIERDHSTVVYNVRTFDEEDFIDSCGLTIDI